MTFTRKFVKVSGSLWYDKRMKTIVVAYDKNYAIGANNDLLWQRDLPADLRHFKDITTGGAIIMGHKTYESIGRPLPNRQNIVISRQNRLIDGVLVVDSLEAAYENIEAGREAYIIGGGQIYLLALDTADCIMATEVDAVFTQASVFFPAVDKIKWREVSRESHVKDDRNLYDYDFVIYERI